MPNVKPERVLTQKVKKAPKITMLRDEYGVPFPEGNFMITLTKYNRRRIADGTLLIVETKEKTKK